MAVTDEAMSRVFGRLRPVCVAFTKSPSRDVVRMLTHLLGDVSDQQLTLLHDYVIFPLRVFIKQSPTRDAELYRDVVDCLRHVVSRSPVTRVDAFHDLFNSLCILISGPAAQVSARPEELKLAVVECLRSVLTGVDASLRRSLYLPTFLPSLGHAVSLLLNLVSNESLRGLQAAAGRCLLQLLAVNTKGEMPGEKNPKKLSRIQTSRIVLGESGRCLLQLLSVHTKDKDIRMKVGNTFSSFLPGVAMAMTRVATGDVKQGHLVTTVALEVLTETVSIVMGDSGLGENQKSPETCDSHTGLPSEMAAKLADLRVTRSDDWVKVTADRLQILVDKIATLVTHPSWQVRTALVNWAQSLLTDCSKSMPGASSSALDILVQLSADDYDSVANHSQVALDSVRTRMDAGGSQRLLVVLEENLHDLATRLPRLVMGSDDEKKLSTLVLFSGYLKLLGPGIGNLLLSTAHLQRVSMALLQVLEFDTSQLELVQEAHTGFQLSIESRSGCDTAPRFYFRHFRDEAIHNQLVTVCRVLGHHGDLNLLVDHFLEIAHQSSTYRKQAFYVINELILGVKGDEQVTRAPNKSRDDIPAIIECLLEEYLSPDNWDIETHAQSDPITRHRTSADWRIVPANQRPNTLLERTSNILQICILLEGISSFAQVSGASFQPHLVDVIYPLMERLGDNMAAINSTAQRVSQTVATACGYRDVHELVCENSDYLVNAISLRLRHIERYPRSPCVLQSVLRHSTATVLPLFEDVIQEVFLVLDDHYDTRAAVFMEVLYALTTAIAAWYPHHTPQTSDTGGSPPAKIRKLSDNSEDKQSGTQTEDENSLVDFISDYHNLKKAAEGEMETGDSGPDYPEMTSPQDEEEGKEDEKKVIPQHIQVVKQVLERCCHLLSSPDPRLRLLVLRTVTEGCKAMQTEQDELLPMAHKLWGPFVKRFQDDEPLVSLAAIETLGTLGQTTGDFLRRRYVEQVLPPMATFLTKQAKVSSGAGARFRHTVLGKLQVSVLVTVSSINSQMNLDGCLLYRIGQACLPYLSSRQPSYLQKIALAAFQHFLTVDADAVWLLLIEEHSPEPLLPPDCRYSHHKVGSSKKSNHSDNIQILLDMK